MIHFTTFFTVLFHLLFWNNSGVVKFMPSYFILDVGKSVVGGRMFLRVTL